MNILHEPIFDIEKIIDHYTKKDGVEIKYVCTSAANTGTIAADIFYRETPHPQFDNHYFGLYRNPYSEEAQIMITNADPIEGLEFGMIGNETIGWVYSQHRHDYRSHGGGAIDGGRAYVRRSSDGSDTNSFKLMTVRDGKFIEMK